MEGFEEEEVFRLHEHPSFLWMLFDTNNGVVNMHHKDEVQIENKDSIRRFWSYTTFAFLFNKFENRY
jgi:hypothetical protein